MPTPPTPFPINPDEFYDSVASGTAPGKVDVSQPAAPTTPAVVPQTEAPAPPMSPAIGAPAPPAVAPATAPSEVPQAAPPVAEPVVQPETTVAPTEAPVEEEDHLADFEDLIDPELYKSLKERADPKMTLGEVFAMAGLAIADPDMARQVGQNRHASKSQARQGLLALQQQKLANEGRAKAMRDYGEEAANRASQENQKVMLQGQDRTINNLLPRLGGQIVAAQPILQNDAEGNPDYPLFITQRQEWINDVQTLVGQADRDKAEQKEIRLAMQDIGEDFDKLLASGNPNITREVLRSMLDTQVVLRTPMTREDLKDPEVDKGFDDQVTLWMGQALQAQKKQDLLQQRVQVALDGAALDREEFEVYRQTIATGDAVKLTESAMNNLAQMQALESSIKSQLAGMQMRERMGRIDPIKQEADLQELQISRNRLAARNFWQTQLDVAAQGALNRADPAQTLQTAMVNTFNQLGIDPAVWPELQQHLAANPSSQEARDFARGLGVELLKIFGGDQEAVNNFIASTFKKGGAPLPAWAQYHLLKQQAIAPPATGDPSAGPAEQTKPAQPE